MLVSWGAWRGVVGWCAVRRGRLGVGAGAASERREWPTSGKARPEVLAMLRVLVDLGGLCADGSPERLVCDVTMVLLGDGPGLAGTRLERHREGTASSGGVTQPMLPLVSAN